MKKDDFDLEILENADNEVIDALNSFPSADEEIKRRVFSMSEKKFNDLNNNFEATDENSVRGVETYRKPKWYRAVCAAAAALVLVGGGTATFAALHKTKKSNESMQAASEIETDYNENDITGEPEPVSETDDEETDENRGEIIKNEGIDISQIAPIAAEPSKSVKDYSDEELNEVAKQLVNIYADWDTLIVSDTVTCEDSVGFYMDGDIPDFSYNYYLLNDPRFSNMKEMVEYYSPYMDEALILSSCEDRNGIENGTYLDPKVYPDYQSTPNLIEHDGKLYAGAYGSPYFEVTGYSIDKKEDDYFIVSVDTDAFTDINLKLKIAKSDDGNFKVVDDQDSFPYGKSFD